VLLLRSPPPNPLTPPRILPQRVPSQIGMPKPGSFAR
jgi:hypothetical protein